MNKLPSKFQIGDNVIIRFTPVLNGKIKSVQFTETDIYYEVEVLQYGETDIFEVPSKLVDTFTIVNTLPQ